ncbi:MAG: hypothetical protein H7145_08340 [Akkermansiaceae bacterium]|nr:hypothetical protein [Armatimonadota bacterium]
MKNRHTVLFTAIEDEAGYPLQVVCLGEALGRVTLVILLSRTNEAIVGWKQ